MGMLSLRVSKAGDHPAHDSVPRSRSNASVVAAMATTLLLWSSAFVAIRVANDGFSVPGLTLARLTIASVALGAVAPLFKVRVPAPGDAPHLVACALTGMTGYQLFLNSGERTVGAGTANLLINTSPVLTAVLGWLLLGSRPTGRVWAGVGLGFAGAGILALTHGGGVRLSVNALLVLGAALCQATFFVLQKPVLRRYSAFELTCYATWVASISALPAIPQAARDVMTANGPALASVVFLGIGSSAIAYVTWAYVLSRIDVAAASNTLYLAPLITIVIAWLILGEAPSAITLIGGAIILTGVVVARQRSHSDPRSTLIHRAGSGA
jgi:drug/metabolite transporter (DMT)-like permease